MWWRLRPFVFSCILFSDHDGVGGSQFGSKLAGIEKIFFQKDAKKTFCRINTS